MLPPPRIPKIIHYFWAGGKPIPDALLGYMESWKKYCPDYEMMCWDEDSNDFRSHPFMAQAYDAKMWAFVSDYARLDIIYKMGVIYLDTDVELTKNWDQLLYHNAFLV